MPKAKRYFSKAMVEVKYCNIRGFMGACNELLTFLLQLSWNSLKPPNWASIKKKKSSSMF